VPDQPPCSAARRLSCAARERTLCSPLAGPAGRTSVVGPQRPHAHARPKAGRPGASGSGRRARDTVAAWRSPRWPGEWEEGARRRSEGSLPRPGLKGLGGRTRVRARREVLDFPLPSFHRPPSTKLSPRSSHTLTCANTKIHRPSSSASGPSSRPLPAASRPLRPPSPLRPPPLCPWQNGAPVALPAAPPPAPPWPRQGRPPLPPPWPP